MVDFMFIILITIFSVAIIFYSAGYFTGKALEQRKIAKLLDTYYNDFLEINYNE